MSPFSISICIHNDPAHQRYRNLFRQKPCMSNDVLQIRRKDAMLSIFAIQIKINAVLLHYKDLTLSLSKI
jgi:hypothetical protein